MKYRFEASENFWKKFYGLPARQKDRVRAIWLIFKENPFDSRLGTHRINSLSARYKKTVYSVVVEGDLRVVFFMDGDSVWTVV